jgi:DNA-binding MarR family transcriptional regulator
MTTPSAATRPLTSRDIGETEHALRAVLDALLARTGTSFLQWVALNGVSLAAGGTVTARDPLARQLAGGLKLDERVVLDTFNELVAAGLLATTDDDPEGVRLTPAGEARHQQLRGEIGGVTERLYADLAADDLVVAHRVLASLTARANAELATM